MCRWAAARPLGRAAVRALLGRAAVCTHGVFRAPEAPAARETRQPRFARCRVSKPARALRSLRRPPHQWLLVADAWFGASSRSPARPRHRPPAPQPAPVGQLGRLSETVVAFAGAGRASTETTIAFVGAKWVFLVHLSGAEAMPVSRLPCWGRAVVLLVSTSLCCCASCAKKFALRGLMVGVSAKKFALRGLMVGVSAKKFALRAHNGPKLAFSGVLGEVFRGNAAGGAVLGEFFRDPAAAGARGRTLSRRSPGSWPLYWQC